MSIVLGTAPDSLQEIKATSYKFTTGTSEAMRMFRCDWADIDASVRVFLARPASAPGVLLDQEIATFPGKEWLAVKSVSVDPFDSKAVTTVDADDLATCQAGAVLKVTYHPRPQIPDDFPVVNLSVDMGAEFLRVPTHGGVNSGYKWTDVGPFGASDTAVGDDVKLHQVMPTEAWELGIKRLPRPAWATIRAARGHVNETTMFGLEPETVLFLGLKASEAIDKDGEITWEPKYRFDVKRFIFEDPILGDIVGTWNHWPRPNFDPATDPPWQKIVPNIYSKYQLLNLFLPGGDDEDMRTILTNELNAIT